MRFSLLEWQLPGGNYSWYECESVELDTLNGSASSLPITDSDAMGEIFTVVTRGR